MNDMQHLNATEQRKSRQDNSHTFGTVMPHHLVVSVSHLGPSGAEVPTRWPRVTPGEGSLITSGRHFGPKRKKCGHSARYD